MLTEHARFALGAGLARRYPADVIPFAGVADPTPEAATALAGLMASGEDIYVLDPFPSANRDLLEIGELPCWQMIFDRAGGPLPTIEPSRTAAVRALGKADVPAMVALTDRAFPGFFRARTFELGRYYGIHVDGVLVAMAGQRLALPGCRELSAVCTHPEHTGRGYAALLVNQLLQLHAAAGLCSFLHVAAVNARAIALYERAGFAKTREIVFRRLKRRYEP